MNDSISKKEIHWALSAFLFFYFFFFSLSELEYISSQGLFLHVFDVAYETLCLFNFFSIF